MNASIFDEVQRLLFPETPKEELAPGWLQSCPTSLSCLGNAMSVASGLRIVLLNKNPKNSFVPRLVEASFEQVIEDDLVTSILTLPVVEAGRRSSSSSHMTWHCTIVGYKSGYVEFLTDSGDLLLRRRFVESPVVDIRAACLNSEWPRVNISEMIYAGDADEVLIGHGNQVISINGRILHQRLYLHKSKLAEAKAQGNDIADILSSIQCKKYLVREQNMNCFEVIHNPNVPFDQYEQLSLSQNNINAYQLGGFRSITQFVTVGQNPFIQYNWPYNMQRQDINELAGNVVSTVKSGLFRMATDMIWGSNSKKAEEAKKDPEQKLTLFHAFKDFQKTGLEVQKSPNKQYLAVADDQNRVMVVQASSGIILHAWKGYHHVQLGWITVTSCGPLNDMLDKVPKGTKASCLLVIYLPRRGTLEVWSVEKKQKVAAFAVSKFGRLVPTQGTILTGGVQKNFVRMAGTSFLEPDGTLLEIVIPFRAVIEKTTSAIDSVQHEKLKILLNSWSVEEGKSGDLVEVIAGARSTAAKASMIIEVCSFDKLSQEIIKEVLDNCKADQESREMPSQVIMSCLSTLDHLWNFVNLVKIKHDSSALDSQDFLENFKDFSQEEKEKLFNSIPPKVEERESELTVKMLVEWLDLTTAVFEHRHENIKIQPMKTNEESSVLLKSLVALANDHFEAASNIWNDLSVDPKEILIFIFQSFCNADRESLISLQHRLSKLFALIYRLPRKETGGHIRRTDTIFENARDLLRTQNMSFPLFAMLQTWETFISEKEDVPQWHLYEVANALPLIKSYLLVDNNFNEFLEKRNTSKDKEAFSLETVFMAGNGKVPEILAIWMLDANLGPEDLSKVDMKDFLEACKDFFPNSVRDETILAHMAWESCHRWKQNRIKVNLLENGFHCLKKLQSLNVGLTNRLTALIWKMILDRMIREAVNVVELRSESRCLRELEIGQKELTEVLKVAVGLARIVIDTDTGTQEEKEEVKKYYDNFCLASKPNLMDMLCHGSIQQQARAANELISFQYQFAVVTWIIHAFRMRFETRPLKLFSHQESNSFFQTESSSSMPSLTLISLSRGHDIQQHRKKFLRNCALYVVQTIHSSPDQDGTVKLDTDEYSLWTLHLNMLGKMWFMSDELKESLVFALYKAGFDRMGQETLAALADKRKIGSELLSIAIMRVTKIFYESPDHLKRVATVKSSMLDCMASMQSQAIELSEIKVEDTKDFLFFLCMLKLEDDEQQVIYDFLSLVQTFMTKK